MNFRTDNSKGIGHTSDMILIVLISVSAHSDVSQLHYWPPKGKFQSWSFSNPIKCALGELVPNARKRVDFLLRDGLACLANTAWVVGVGLALYWSNLVFNSIE
jgi:hypothetical protein